MSTTNIIKIIFLVFIILFIYLWEQMESENTLLKIKTFNSHLLKEKNEYEQLRVVYNRLISTDRLDEISRNYDLFPPKKEQILNYETNSK